MKKNSSQTLKSLLVMSSLSLLISCGGKGYEEMSLNSEESATGFETPEGIEYTAGGDSRIVLEKSLIAPLNPELPSSEENRSLKFNQSLKDFVFLRYDKGSDQPSRLGKDAFSFQVLVNNSKWISFSGTLSEGQPSKKILETTVSKDDSSYSLSGEIDDFKDHVVGRLIVTQAGLSVTILYRAYKAEMRVRTPEDKNLDEHQNLKRKIGQLQSTSFAWVNTFTIPFGVSTYDVAMVNQTTQGSSSIQPLEFRGESLNTGKIEEVKVTIKEGIQDQDLESISLIGNAEAEDSKIFAVKMKDDKGETTEVMVDIERKKSEEELAKEKEREQELIQQLYEPVAVEEDDSADMTPAVEPSVEEKIEPKVESKGEPKKELEKAVVTHDQQDLMFDEIQLPEGEDVPLPTFRPDYKPKKETSTTSDTRTAKAPSGGALGNNSKSYLIASSGSNALKIIKDFETNFTLSGVQKEIKKIKNSKAEVKKLKAFFKYANPFRGMIEKIAKAYSVPPQYAYVSLIESAYFYGGQYKIQTAPGSTATGPFQIIYGTAKSLGMRVIKNAFGRRPGASDERNYFAPSACAAAKYFRNNAKMFPRDATLAILAYNQGEGRALQLAKRYGYDYSQISKNNVKGITYSNQKLAAYFLAGAYEGSSFDVDSQSPKNLPGNVRPKSAMKDKTCASLF